MDICLVGRHLLVRRSKLDEVNAIPLMYATALELKIPQLNETPELLAYLNCEHIVPEPIAKVLPPTLSLLGVCIMDGWECAYYQGEITEDERRTLAAAADSLECDLLCAERFPRLNAPGCLIMDMDMTSVTIEGIDEIARSLGVYDEVAALTASAMHGHCDFATSLRRRVALLKGGDASVLEQVKARMYETPGLENLMSLMSEQGFKTAIASGGFVQLISVLDERYGLDLIRANKLGIKDGRFTGEVEGPIVDADGKEAALLELRRTYGIAREQSIAIGDGANDLKMIKAAGLGIAYHAKPAVRAAAPCAINHGNLGALTVALDVFSVLVRAF